MSARSKSGQKRRRRQIRARMKRRLKRKKAALVAAGHTKKTAQAAS
jgi:hypothetical protein